jgi:hypothetical protein
MFFPGNHLKETINNKKIGLLRSNALGLGSMIIYIIIATVSDKGKHFQI